VAGYGIIAAMLTFIPERDK